MQPCTSALHISTKCPPSQQAVCPLSPGQDDLDAFRAAALEVAQLWVSFLQAQPTPAKDAAQRTALDARYFSGRVARLWF